MALSYLPRSCTELWDNLKWSGQWLTQDIAKFESHLMSLSLILLCFWNSFYRFWSLLHIFHTNLNLFIHFWKRWLVLLHFKFRKVSATFFVQTELFQIHSYSALYKDVYDSSKVMEKNGHRITSLGLNWKKSRNCPNGRSYLCLLMFLTFGGYNNEFFVFLLQKAIQDINEWHDG